MYFGYDNSGLWYIKTHSGDDYLVPECQADEIAEYWLAVESKEWNKVLDFETDVTGWQSLESYKIERFGIALTSHQERVASYK